MPKSKGGLGGRGLSALYAATSEEYGFENEIDIERIHPNPNQPRKDFDKAKIDDLATSIKQKGLIEPIVVRPVDGGEYEIVAGERRWQACKSIGQAKIKAIVREASDQEAMELALIENLHRDDLNPIEEARGYRLLIDTYKLKQSDVATQVSKSRSAVANSLRLLDLPAQVQDYLLDGRMSAGHARAILSIPNEEQRISIAAKVVEQGLTVRETENLVRLMSSSEEGHSKRQASPKKFKSAAKSLRQKLDAEVRVTNSRGKNKIVITFSDEDDLDRICNQILGE